MENDRKKMAWCGVGMACALDLLDFLLFFFLKIVYLVCG